MLKILQPTHTHMTLLDTETADMRKHSITKHETINYFEEMLPVFGIKIQPFLFPFRGTTNLHTGLL